MCWTLNYERGKAFNALVRPHFASFTVLHLFFSHKASVKVAVFIYQKPSKSASNTERLMHPLVTNNSSHQDSSAVQQGKLDENHI